MTKISLHFADHLPMKKEVIKDSATSLDRKHQLTKTYENQIKYNQDCSHKLLLKLKREPIVMSVWHALQDKGLRR